MVVTVSPKYQVVIPKEVRQALDLEPGTKVSVIAKGGIAYIVPNLSRDRIRGMVKTVSDKIPLRDKKDRSL